MNGMAPDDGDFDNCMRQLQRVVFSCVRNQLIQLPIYIYLLDSSDTSQPKLQSSLRLHVRFCGANGVQQSPDAAQGPALSASSHSPEMAEKKLCRT